MNDNGAKLWMDGKTWHCSCTLVSFFKIIIMMSGTKKHPWQTVVGIGVKVWIITASCKELWVSSCIKMGQEQCWLSFPGEKRTVELPEWRQYPKQRMTHVWHRMFEQIKNNDAISYYLLTEQFWWQTDSYWLDSPPKYTTYDCWKNAL